AAVASVNNSLPNSMAGSPLSLGHHLSRMTQQFGAPMGLGSNTNALQNLPPGMNMSMFSPDMLTAMHQLANLPQHNGNLSTSAAASSALQQLHNNLQQHSATIIN
uniref:Dachshund n=1 Tax=Panagrolaimus sp. PS1159 TaxID=55785 RepID=A0AC35EYW4_9BILA